jgi:hypothetical protein
MRLILPGGIDRVDMTRRLPAAGGWIRHAHRCATALVAADA